MQGTTPPQHWVEKLHPGLLQLLEAYKQLGVAVGKQTCSRKDVRRRVLRSTAESLGAIRTTFASFPGGTMPKGLAPEVSEDEARTAAYLNLAKLLGQTRPLGLRYKKPPAFLGYLKTGLENPEALMNLAPKPHDRGSQLVLKAMRKPRAGRSRLPTLKKTVHEVIVACGLRFGAWQGIESELSLAILSWEEAAELFNTFCPLGCHHTPEQIRKIITRSIDRCRRNHTRRTHPSN